MGKVNDVLCTASSSTRLFLAARHKSQLYLIRSTINPVSFAEARWELFTKEPLQDLPDLGSSDVSCAVGDDNSFVIMGLRRWSEADNSSTFWGATYNYNSQVTRRSTWNQSISNISCKVSDSCNHVVLAARSSWESRAKFVHLVYQDSAAGIQISPFAQDGFRNYTLLPYADPPLDELALFTYLDGGLTSLRLKTDTDNKTMSMEIQSLKVDLEAVPLPNAPPLSKISVPIQQYCYMGKPTLGKLGGSSGENMFFWCQSFRENYGVYEFNGANVTRIAEIQRMEESYGADSYLPAPSVNLPNQSSSATGTTALAPAWGIVLRAGSMYSFAQPARGANLATVWENSGKPLSIDLDGFPINNGGNKPLSNAAVAFVAIGSVLAVSLLIALGLWLYQRHRRAKFPTVDETLPPPLPPLDLDSLYAFPWTSVASLPPPYAPPEEPLPAGSERHSGEGSDQDAGLNQDSQNGLQGALASSANPEEQRSPSSMENQRPPSFQEGLHEAPLQGESLGEAPVQEPSRSSSIDSSSSSSGRAVPPAQVPPPARPSLEGEESHEMGAL